MNVISDLYSELLCVACFKSLKKMVIYKESSQHLEQKHFYQPCPVFQSLQKRGDVSLWFVNCYWRRAVPITAFLALQLHAITAASRRTYINRKTKQHSHVRIKEKGLGFKNNTLIELQITLLLSHVLIFVLIESLYQRVLRSCFHRVRN